MLLLHWVSQLWPLLMTVMVAVGDLWLGWESLLSSAQPFMPVPYNAAAPYWIKQPESQIYAPGETVRLHCQAEGIPTPTITWSLNGVPISGQCRTVLCEITRCHTHLVVFLAPYGCDKRLPAVCLQAWSQTPDSVWRGAPWSWKMCSPQTPPYTSVLPPTLMAPHSSMLISTSLVSTRQFSTSSFSARFLKLSYIKFCIHFLLFIWFYDFFFC